MMGPVLSRIIALVMLAALAGAATYYPANKVLLAVSIAGYGALLWYRPCWWLLLVPAFLPILDFAPWTGWFFLDELDLLLMATAAVGYWRIGAQVPAAGLPPFAASSFGLVGCAFFVSAVIGLLPLTKLDANAFSDYASHYNSLRIAKGWLWAVILLPLLRRSAGPELENLQRYFVPGMLLGLAGTCLAVAWERAVFPGLLNFASDYRPTAPFSAMHTGGAALDAYLAISFPFVALWLIGAKSPLRLGLALMLLLFGCYAGLATFSRDVYLAYACAGAVLGALTLAHRFRRGTVNRRLLFATAVLVVMLAFGFTRVFGSSGYRGLAACVMLIGAAIGLAAVPQRLEHRAAIAAGAGVLALLGVALFLYLGKGAYLAFIVSSGLFALGMLLHWLGAPARQSLGHALAAAAFPALALATGMVAYHWGGAGAGRDAAWLIGIGFGVIGLNRCLPEPIWRLDRPTVTLASICAIIFATTIPFAGSYYLGARFATVGTDFSTRVRHWSEALDMMTPDWQTSAFGMGLGRYPQTYFWKNARGEMPGTYSYQVEANGNMFLQLGTAHHAIGYGDVLRMLQHVAVGQGKRYRLALDVRRAPSANATINIAICERWLLYPQNCAGVPLRLLPADGEWHRYEMALETGRLGAPGGLFGPPTQLEISSGGTNSRLDVDNVSLQDQASGSELMRNGAFSYGNDDWFFSSDRNHFPWHAKNFAVYILFELGWLGVVALTFLLGSVMGALAVRGVRGDPVASTCLAALLAFLVVGLFDSLMDVPRLTLIFLLVVLVASLSPAQKTAPAGLRRRRSQRAPRQDPEDLMA